MSYLDAYLQPCPGYGWQGGPSFRTRIVSMATGRERRNADIAEARHQFQSPFNNITREAYRNIKQMHLVCRGMLHCFKFRDELDFRAENEVFAQGNASDTVFQLRKISQIDGVSYVRNTYVISGTPVIRVDGTPTSVTVDDDRGLITFGTAPSNGATISGDWEFDIWVRFNQDYLPFSIDNGDGTGRHYVNGSVDLIEVPPPPAP